MWKRSKAKKQFSRDDSKVSHLADTISSNLCATLGSGTLVRPLFLTPNSPNLTELSNAFEHCEPAWRNLSVGSFDEAVRLSQLEDDYMCRAAALALSGETTLALRAIEALIVSTCVALYEWRTQPGISLKKLKDRSQEIMMSWIASEKSASRTIGKSANVDSDTMCTVVMEASVLLHWDLVHRWFLVALFLHDREYDAPKNAWFRYFFALFPSDSSLESLQETQRGKKRGVEKERIRRPINGESTQDTLVAQCEPYELDLITAITAYKRRHYRTAITSATVFLRTEDVGCAITDDNMRTFARFMRCMCFLQIGERIMAAEDAQVMLRSDDRLVSTTGASILAFTLPLVQAIPIVTGYEGSIMERRYVYALCEYVHALTLVQLGSMEPAVRVIETAVTSAPRNDVGEWLHDLLVIACTALEDSSAILRTPLSADQQVYIAMSPAFFGGFVEGYTRAWRRTPAGRLICPKQVPAFASVRQTLPYRMNRSHRRAINEQYKEAWEDACVAASCADEIIGSVEFAFTLCSPLNVYAFACDMGLRLLHLILETTTTDLSDRGGGSGGDAGLGNGNERAEALISNSDSLGNEIIRKCGEWAERIRQFHPNVRLGRIVRAQYGAAVREENFISRSIHLARLYPRNVLAQTVLTLALYANHHIPEAVDNAAKTLQDFPHAAQAIAMERVVESKSNTYYFNYRTLVPVRYAPGTNRMWTKRSFTVMLLLFANFVTIVVTMLCNMLNWIHVPEWALPLALRLQLPFKVPLFFAIVVIVYSLVAALSSRNLLRTMMQELYFSDTRLNRFLFGIRGLAFVNVFNALQITIAGNNFMFGSFWYTTLLYLVLSIHFVPFTTRVWFLPSVDEPKAGIWTWLTLLSVDTATAFIVLIPHIILIAFEPLMFIIFFFFQPVQRPDSHNVSGNIKKRLELHQAFLKRMPSRYTAGSGSRFIHVRAMSLLYYQTHSDLATKFILDAQMEEDNCRVFPLIEVSESISTKPIRFDAQKREQLSSSGKRRNLRGLLPDAEKDDITGPLQRGTMGAQQISSGIRSTENEDLDTGRPQVAGVKDKISSAPRRNTDPTSFTCPVQDSIDDDVGSLNAVLAVTTRFLRLPKISLSSRDSDQGPNRGSRRESNAETAAPPSRCSGENASPRDNASASMSSSNTSSESPESPEERDNGNAPVVEVSAYRGSLAGAAPQQGADTYTDSTGNCSPVSLHVDPHVLDATTNLLYGHVRSSDVGDLARENLIDSFAQPTVSPRTSISEVTFLSDAAVSPEERPLFRALRDMMNALSNAGTTSIPKEMHVARLSQCRKAIVNEIAKLCSAQGRDSARLTSYACIDCCSRVFPRLVMDGESDDRPLTTGNVRLVYHLMTSLDVVKALMSTLLQRGVLEQCVLDGSTDMLRVVLTPAGVRCLGISEWEGLLRAVHYDALPNMSDTLTVLLDAANEVHANELCQALVPHFQAAVHAALVSNADKLSRGALEGLLHHIEEHNFLYIDYCEVEDESGHTIFSKACAVGDEQLVTTLWDLGLLPNPNRVQCDGTNALMQAVLHERLNIVRWFAQVGMHVVDSFLYSHPQRGTVLQMVRSFGGIGGDSGRVQALIKKEIQEVIIRMNLSC